MFTLMIGTIVLVAIIFVLITAFKILKWVVIAVVVLYGVYWLSKLIVSYDRTTGYEPCEECTENMTQNDMFTSDHKMKITGNRGNVWFDDYKGRVVEGICELGLNNVFVRQDTFIWKDTREPLTKDEAKDLMDKAKQSDKNDFLVFW